MPYVPLSDGQLIFVETQEEADRLYNESWGQETAAEAQPAAPQQPAPAEQQQEAAPTAQAQPEVPEERTSLRSERERPLTKYIDGS